MIAEEGRALGMLWGNEARRIRNREDWRRKCASATGAADARPDAKRRFCGDGQKIPGFSEKSRGEKEEPSAPQGAHGYLWAEILR